MSFDIHVSKHIFMPCGGYCVSCPSYMCIFHNTHSFENWEISLGYSPSYSWGLFSHVICFNNHAQAEIFDGL